EFTGFGFPTTILIFKNGIVTWYVKNAKFYGLGAKLLKIYRDEKKEKEMVEETFRRLGVLKKVEEEINGKNISDLTNEQLAELYSRLHDAFINYYGVGAIQEP